MCLFPNQGAWLLGGFRYPSDLMREPWDDPVPRAVRARAANQTSVADLSMLRCDCGRLLQPFAGRIPNVNSPAGGTGGVFFSGEPIYADGGSRRKAAPA